jgi:glycosyltransferase involved in cell wall biosynthesis
MQRLLPHADLFIAISRHTRAELATLDPALLAARRAIVTPLAHEFPHAASGAVSPEIERIRAQDYVLHVGRIEPRKNLVTLLQVWRRLAGELGETLPLLVLAGRMNFPGDEFSAALAALDPERVCLVADISSAELARLYENCRFAVYPSFYEGWGLPVGEAASFGKVTAASNAAAIPEVVGDLAVYFDPRNADEMAAVLRRLITDRAYLTSLETRLRREFRPRRWSDCAHDILAAAEKLGG